MIKGPYPTNRAQLRQIWKHTFRARNTRFQDPVWRERLQGLVELKAKIESRLDKEGKFRA